VIPHTFTNGFPTLADPLVVVVVVVVVVASFAFAFARTPRRRRPRRACRRVVVGDPPRTDAATDASRIDRVIILAPRVRASVRSRVRAFARSRDTLPRRAACPS
jgi:hypothetical protein